MYLIVLIITINYYYIFPYNKNRSKVLLRYFSNKKCLQVPRADLLQIKPHLPIFSRKLQAKVNYIFSRKLQAKINYEFSRKLQAKVNSIFSRKLQAKVN